MKKLKKLFAALLALAMLLSLTVPALAGTLADPRECPYCGNGTYGKVSTLKESRINPDTKIPCVHGWPGYWDGMKQFKYEVKEGCTNHSCKYSLSDATAAIEYRDIGWVCEHDNSGMGLGDVVS